MSPSLTEAVAKVFAEEIAKIHRQSFPEYADREALERLAELVGLVPPVTISAHVTGRGPFPGPRVLGRLPSISIRITAPIRQVEIRGTIKV